jgi:hypothetical protein
MAEKYLSLSFGLARAVGMALLAAHVVDRPEFLTTGS